MVIANYESQSGTKIYLVKERDNYFMYWGPENDLSKLSRQELLTPSGNRPRNVNKYFLKAAKAVDYIVFEKL
jgi:hypothetical protein